MPPASQFNAMTIMMKKLLFTLAFYYLLAFSGCTESGDVRMQLFVYDKQTDTYKFDNVLITTLDDVEQLKGTATVVYGGASITLDYSRNELRWKDRGNPVAFEAIEQDGVLVPVDYDSLAMASIYYNIEKTWQFFTEDLQLPAGVMDTLRTYYWSDFTIIDVSNQSSRMYDNAFYMYISAKEQAFFIVPFDVFEWIPMPLNSGIMTHEYSHAVFDNLVMSSVSQSQLSASASNFLYGINEGCADFFAVAKTGDPDYISHSIPKLTYANYCSDPTELLDVVRDASVITPYETIYDTAARNTVNLEFCPYDIGRFWASLLYEIARSLDNTDDTRPRAENLQQVASWLLEALIDLSEQVDSNFELWDILSLLVAQVETQTDRDTVCSAIENMYSMYYSSVSGC